MEKDKTWEVMIPQERNERAIRESMGGIK